MVNHDWVLTATEKLLLLGYSQVSLKQTIKLQGWVSVLHRYILVTVYLKPSGLLVTQRTLRMKEVSKSKCTTVQKK